MMSTFSELIKGTLGPFINYAVIDVETSSEWVDDGWESLPRTLKGGVPTPAILCAAARTNAFPGNTTLRHCRDPGFADLVYNIKKIDHETMAVGHNISFDYQHLRPVCWKLVWDTMIADYVLSAQKNKFSSLGELMKREAGMEPKRDLIGEYMARGVAPQDIPWSEMEPYARKDIEGTEAVFLSQYGRATDAQRRLIIILSVASLAYADCSANGLGLDQMTSVTRRDNCYAESERMAEGFMEVWAAGNPHAHRDIQLLKDSCVRQGYAESRWATTPTAMSSLLFNTPPVITAGTVPAPEVGARRVRNVLLESPLKGSTPPVFPPPTKTREILSTADDILNEIRNTEQEPYASLAAMEQRRRENHKLGKTYYQALLEQAARYCGRIHPTINSTTAATGRTSSSNPNIQNQPPETREVFVADKGNIFLEFDFQQLEMWALAVVSGCESLRKALERGDDVHYLTGVEAGMWSDPSGMTKEGRKLVKRINFGLIYGGTATGLAKQSRTNVGKVRKIILGFYGRFPGVKAYHDGLLRWAAGDTTTSPSPMLLSKEDNVFLGTTGTVTEVVVRTSTGRSYSFEKDAAQEAHRRNLSISPTKLKNYPIQGFGTGDFVPLVLACLWHRVAHTMWRAVVHDAALLEIKDTGITGIIEKFIRDAVEEAQDIAKFLWTDRADIQLNVSFEHKHRWSPMKEEHEDAAPVE